MIALCLHTRESLESCGSQFKIYKNATILSLQVSKVLRDLFICICIVFTFIIVIYGTEIKWKYHHMRHSIVLLLLYYSQFNNLRFCLFSFDIWKKFIFRFQVFCHRAMNYIICVSRLILEFFSSIFICLSRWVSLIYKWVLLSGEIFKHAYIHIFLLIHIFWMLYTHKNNIYALYLFDISGLNWRCGFFLFLIRSFLLLYILFLLIALLLYKKNLFMIFGRRLIESYLHFWLKPNVRDDFCQRGELSHKSLLKMTNNNFSSGSFFSSK